MKKAVCILLGVAAAIALASCRAQSDAVVPAHTTFEQPSGDLPPPTPLAPPDPFILMADDGASRDRFGDIALIGMRNSGDDGSVHINLSYTNAAAVGESSVHFRYMPPGGEHWAGAVFLFASGQFHADPGASGPDVSRHTDVVFYVRGTGGRVRFFAEFDGGAQSAQDIVLTDDWVRVALPIGSGRAFCNIPLGWAANDGDSDTAGGVIEFWVDGVRFE